MRSGAHARLLDLRSRLLTLHKMLLDDQRRAYESKHGRAVSSGELFQLVLQHDEFAWLRSLSGIVSAIDAALDETDGVLPDVDLETFFQQAGALLRSDRTGPFETRYRDALQRSPDIVMAHASVVALL